jgi:hypothetical protein
MGYRMGYTTGVPQRPTASRIGRYGEVRESETSLIVSWSPTASGVVAHSKCGGRKPMGVRVPPPPLMKNMI